jgi:hypothetical protein
VEIGDATYYVDFKTGYRRDDAKFMCENLDEPMSLLHFENDRFNQKWKNVSRWLKDNGKLFKKMLLVKKQKLSNTGKNYCLKKYMCITKRSKCKI